MYCSIFTYTCSINVSSCNECLYKQCTSSKYTCRSWIKLGEAQSSITCNSTQQHLLLSSPLNSHSALHRLLLALGIIAVKVASPAAPALLRAALLERTLFLCKCAAVVIVPVWKSFFAFFFFALSYLLEINYADQFLFACIVLFSSLSVE